MGPIDYTTQVQNPLQSALQGYQLGTTIRADQQQQQAQEAALEQQRALSAARNAAFQSPTADNFARLMTLDPKSSEAYQRAWSTKNTEQQQSLAADLLQWGAAIKSGKPQIAAEQLTRRADLLEQQNGGQPTPDSRAMRMQAQLAAEHPEFALGQIQALLAANPNGKDAAETLSKFGTEQRAADLFPDQKREGAAKADKAVADAGAAVSEAQTKAVDAKYAEQKAKDEIAKRAAELGLTKAQTAQAQALTSKYGADTQKTLLEIAQVGKPTQAQKFEAEAKLRGEYNNGTKVFTDVSEAYRRLKASNNDAAGDLSLIFSYMKMLDPGSVVREGEFATAQNAAGIDTRVVNLYNRLLNGERLTPKQRAQFAGQGESLFNAAQKREGELRSGLTKVARSYGLNSENIFSGRISEQSGGAPNPQRKPIGDFDRPGES
jgi:hypothetical protein